MKRFLIVLIMLLITSAVNAKVAKTKVNALPQGVFKKSWNGDIVQYDNNGKKAHTYKMKNGKVVKIK